MPLAACLPAWLASAPPLLATIALGSDFGTLLSLPRATNEAADGRGGGGGGGGGKVERARVFFRMGLFN